MRNILDFEQRFPGAEVTGLDVGLPLLRYANLRAGELGSDVRFVQGLAEGVAFAQMTGQDVEAVFDTIGAGAAGSWQMANRHATMAAGEFEFGFAVEHMRKDLGNTLAEARSAGASLPLTALVDQFYAEVQAAGLVGHDVLVPGNSMSLAAGKAAGGFTLPAGTDKVTVTITDGAGQRVRQLDLGKLPAGAQRFEWDGKTDTGVAVKDGSYGISITGTIDGKAVTLSLIHI